MKKLILILLLVLSPLTINAACTWTVGDTVGTAATCSQANIEDCLDDAECTDGDTINIPAGSCAFTSILDVDLATGTKELTILGAGEGVTNISGHGFKITGADGKAFRLSGMTFSGGAGVTIYGQSKTWIVDNIYFDHCTGETQGRIIWVRASGADTAYTSGVIHHCTFDNPGVISFQVRGNSTLGGNETWGRALGLGGSDAVYIEDCTFDMDDTRNRWVVDCDGGNYVFRHNTVTNLGLGMHDAIITGLRGCRKWEIYENDFNIVNKWDMWVGLYLRGGTGVCYNNKWNGPSTSGPIAVATYRYYQTGGDPWDELCNGSAGKATLGLTDNPGDCDSGDDCVDMDGADGWPCRDQLGTDGGKVQSNVPALFWNNKYNTYNVAGYQTSGETSITTLTKGSSAATMVADRDYCIHATTMPATCNGVGTTYTALDHPHPLIGGGGGDVTAPVISYPQPTGEQDCTSDPRNVNISIYTNEDATCKFDISPDITYLNMGTTFSSTGGQTHTHTVTDLPCEDSYIYYTRCTDGTNINSTSTAISFSIGTAGSPSLCSGDDSFTGSNDDPPAASRWVNTGSDIQTNRLRVGYTDASGMDYAISSWTTTGNIEAQVDFDVTGYPETDYWKLILALVIDSTHKVAVEIEYDSSTYKFRREYIDGADWIGNTVAATNNTGKLKILRSGNTFTAHFIDGTSAWTAIGNPVTVGDVGDPVDLRLYANRGTGNPDITGYFDNFQINTNCVIDEPAILTTSPSTEQACTSDPRDVDIVVTTNEICECKKCVDGVGDCDALSVFNDAEMVAFNSTDAKTHTETDSLSCDQTIKYRVICEDVGDVEMEANEDFSFFVASGGADSTPPVQSDLAPPASPNLTCITSSPRGVTISLSTNEIATCKYSLDGEDGDDADTTYDNLAHIFSTTESTFHSQLLSLACGASYTYWVRCQDDEETPNQNVASGEITFIINDAPPPPSTKGLTLTGTGVSGGGLE